MRQPEAEEGLPGARAQRPEELQPALRHPAHPGDRVLQQREEGDQHRYDHLRQEPHAEPRDQEGCGRQLGGGLGGDQVRVEHPFETGRVGHQSPQPHPQHASPEEPQEDLLQSDPDMRPEPPTDQPLPERLRHGQRTREQERRQPVEAHGPLPEGEDQEEDPQRGKGVSPGGGLLFSEARNGPPHPSVPSPRSGPCSFSMTS